MYYDLPTGCNADNCYIVGGKIYDGIYQQAWYVPYTNIGVSLKENKLGMYNAETGWVPGTTLKILLFVTN